MPYNYRVVSLPEEEDDYGEEWFQIRAVYYDNTGNGRVYNYIDADTDLKIEKISPEPPVVMERSLGGLKMLLEKMLDATKKEIIKLES